MPANRTTLQTALAVELAKAGLTQTDLALRGGWRPSTLSGWLRNIGKPPRDLAALLENALDIPRGSLERTHNTNR